MIYFTTLIFTLLLSHFARAVPACGNVASPEDQLEFDTYDDGPVLAKVLPDYIYDNPNSYTLGVACSTANRLASDFPQFSNFFDFPYLGGAFDIKSGSLNCGKCWKLTNKKTGRSINITAIDTVWSKWTGFNIGSVAFNDLRGGTGGPGIPDILDVEAVPITAGPCLRF